MLNMCFKFIHFFYCCFTFYPGPFRYLQILHRLSPSHFLRTAVQDDKVVGVNGKRGRATKKLVVRTELSVARPRFPLNHSHLSSRIPVRADRWVGRGEGSLVHKVLHILRLCDDIKMHFHVILPGTAEHR